MIKTNTKSTQFYDVVRVIATILVVIGHATYIEWTGDSGAISLSTDNACNTFTVLHRAICSVGSWIYGFHMPLFFMLSGAVYTYSRRTGSFDAFAKSKICRLIVPFYLSGLLYMIPIKYVSGFYSRETIKNVVQDFLFGKNSGHLWFLIALFWCLVLFYPIEKYILSRSKYMGIILACIIYNANTYNMFNIAVLDVIPYLRQGVIYLPYLIGGYLFEEIRKKYEINRIVLLIITIMLVVASLLQFRKQFITIPVLIVILGCMTVYAISYYMTKIPRFTQTHIHRVLLRNSMYIYLFHDPINFLMLRWAINNGIVSDECKSILFFGGRTIGAILVSCLLGEMIVWLKKQTGFYILKER